MAKRKRSQIANGDSTADAMDTKKTRTGPTKSIKYSNPVVTFQIVTGSYDRVLHGITASVTTRGNVEFADTFLFTAHTSAIRCVALSPPSAPVPGQTQKVFLASGSTDERINVYNLSAHPPNRKNQELLSAVAPRPILESSKNRELGTLLHHASTITGLSFPTRSKLLSSSEDSTIAVTRTRDWSLLSTIKVPIPRAFGRPTGDTAPLGGTPSGVNGFAIHPSMKLMISVSKGERSMRLWNLVTGKKGGVLNFNRNMLQAVGEGKHSTGEGRRVVWGKTEGGDEFAIGFDRDILVFGMDSIPKCRVMEGHRTKIHHFTYMPPDVQGYSNLLAVSTEDGRVLLFSTKTDDLIQSSDAEETTQSISRARLVAQLGGKDAGISGRLKDFAILHRHEDAGFELYIVGGSSDGTVRLWRLDLQDFDKIGEDKEPRQVGRLLGTYETQNRITCVAAFIMIPRPDGVEESEDEIENESSSSSDDDGEEEDNNSE